MSAVTLGDGAPVIVGAGLAGIAVALALAPAPVTLLAAAPLGEGAASAWAQGGIAAAVGAGDDVAAHLADTLAAGAGLVDPVAAARVVGEGPAVIARLIGYGVAFDRTPDDGLDLGLEAAHGARRIVHAADATGAAIMRALVAAVRATPSIRVAAPLAARRLLIADGAVCGVLAAGPAGQAVVLPARCVVLATGGIGALYAHTTNPPGAIGTGIALAARAGGRVVDMEFVQFHPTALDTGRAPMPLISEAVRGEGAALIDERGRRFLHEAPDGDPRAELAPRDVVAAAIWRHMAAGHRVFLDARDRPGAAFGRHFPAIAAACRAAGIDPARDPIPVRPAAHYHMGGVAVDAAGRTDIAGLYACGEVAATGLHGANRLASNSLLEAAACGPAVAADIAGRTDAHAPPRRLPPLPPLPPAPDAAAVRPILSGAAGVLRDGPALDAAAAGLRRLHEAGGAASDPALVAALVVEAARRRRESRGSHRRTDFPSTDPAQAARRRLGRDDIAAAAPSACAVA